MIDCQQTQFPDNKRKGSDMIPEKCKVMRKTSPKVSNIYEKISNLEELILTRKVTWKKNVIIN